MAAEPSSPPHPASGGNAAAGTAGDPSPWLVLNVIGQLAFGLVVMTLCLPSMQEWGDIFGAEQSSVQLTFSAYVLSYGALQLLYGPLSDRVGRRRILIFGLVLAVLGSVWAVLATSLSSLILARFVQGAGAAAGMVAGRAMVQDLFEGPQRTRVMAYVGMAMGVCPPVATIIGGQLHVHLGWQSNFVLMGLMALGLLWAAWRGLPVRAQRPPVQAHWLRELVASYQRLLAQRAFVLHVAILSLNTATFYAFLSGAPIVLRSYGVGPALVGWYIAAVPLCYILGNYLTSRLAHRVGELRMMVLGQACTFVGLAGVVALALAGIHTPLAFSLPVALMGLGHGFMVPPYLVRTVGLIPALAGAAAAVAGTMQQFVGSAGGYAIGWVPHDGPIYVGLLMLAFNVLAIGAHVRLYGARLDAAKPA